MVIGRCIAHEYHANISGGSRLNHYTNWHVLPLPSLITFANYMSNATHYPSHHIHNLRHNGNGPSRFMLGSIPGRYCQRLVYAFVSLFWLTPGSHSIYWFLPCTQNSTPNVFYIMMLVSQELSRHVTKVRHWKLPTCCPVYMLLILLAIAFFSARL